MTLVINRPPYRGRFHEKAVALVKSGTRVGEMLVVQKAAHTVSCHVCGADFKSPVLTEDDAWGECTKCSLPFVFILV